MMPSPTGDLAMPTKNNPDPTTNPSTLRAATPMRNSALVLKLLARGKGATLSEITKPTGWQPHTTRAFLSRLRTKGTAIIREQRKTGETAYGIIDAANPLVAALLAPVTSALPPLSDLSKANKSPFDVAGGGEQVDHNAGIEAKARAPTPASTAGA